MAYPLAALELWKKEPTHSPFSDAVREVCRSKDFPPYFGFTMGFAYFLIFNSVESLEDIYVKKNMHHSKHYFERQRFTAMMPRSIFTMKTEDPQYVPKRKIIASAFFKNKVTGMMKITREETLKFIKAHQDKKSSEVDLSVFIQELQ